MRGKVRARVLHAFKPRGASDPFAVFLAWPALRRPQRKQQLPLFRVSTFNHDDWSRLRPPWRQ